MAAFETGVLVWWGGLSLVAVFNIVLLVLSARSVLSTRYEAAELARYRRLQLLFGGIYILGCASRSFILRSDGRRYAMFDSFITSVFVGRSTATVAEMAFVVQWALLLYLLSKRDGSSVGMQLSKVLVPIIAVAEVCSWYGVISTNALGHAVEESLWALTAALFMGGLVARFRTATPALKRFLGLSIAACLLYLCYMVFEDVPTYYFRWKDQVASGVDFFSLSDGIADTMRWEVRTTWQDWKREVVWQSLYFSVAVWMSLILIQWPRVGEEAS